MMRHFRGATNCAALISIILLAVAVPAVAQDQGRLVGTVSDDSGAVIPGAALRS